MRSLIFIILVLLFHICNSQNETIQLGGKGNDGIYDLTTDDRGNKYVTGFFQGKFNGLKANGDTDAFVAKLSAENQILWCKQIGSNHRAKNEISEYGKFISIDSQNNIYVLGIYYSQLLTDKTNEYISKGKQDVFLTKFDSNGTLLWIKSIGTYNNESINKLVVDSNDNIYAFVNLANNESNNHNSNFVFKYNTSGELLYNKKIKVNQTSEILITEINYKEDSFYFLSTQSKVNFLSAYNLHFDVIYERQLNSKNEIVSFSVDDLNGFYLLEAEKNLSGRNNSFILKKIDSTGENTWSIEYDTQSQFNPQKIILDSEKIHVIGSLKEKSIIYQYDLSGVQLQEISLSGKYQNRINKYVTKKNNLYIIGQFYNEIDLMKNKIISKGKTDGFIEIISLSKVENIEVENFNKTIFIYPNPNDGKFYLKNVDQIDRVELYDMNGKFLFQKKIIDNSFIEIKNLNNTVYNLIIFKKNNEEETIKLIVDKK